MFSGDKEWNNLGGWFLLHLGWSPKKVGLVLGCSSSSMGSVMYRDEIDDYKGDGKR